MVSARALEVRTGGAVDKGIFTNHHGVHQCGLARRPQGVDLVDDAAMNSGAPEFSPAAGKTGKNLDTSFGRSQCDDAVFLQTAPIVKRARIAVVARGEILAGKRRRSP
jgi:hypothetical protein